MTMRFHHKGYVSGDPRVEPAAGIGLDRPSELPDEMDVLIVGGGPAGMVAAAQLAQFPEVHTRLIDRRGGRLEIGQADGIQARSVETFQAFGFAGSITQEAYQISEMSFWKPDPENPRNIVRTGRPLDDPSGVSEFPHLIVNQARVLDHFAQFARNSPARTVPDWGWEVLDVRVGTGEYPVEVDLRGTTGEHEGVTRTVRARYVLGADGARSQVRDSIGCVPVGDRADHAWGVMDVLAETDFPDIRTKCAIQSHDGGSILLIPREGGHLFRMYVDLGEVGPDRSSTVRQTSLEEVVERANAILHPYTLEVRDVAWRSVYEVGHRVTDRFDDLRTEDAGRRTPRVFIAGDACHTHSAKAGQGMNVSMQDGFNLAWKLGHVLSGRSPESLLATYSAERQEVAQNLIDFDREWSSMMARRPEDFDSPSALEDFYVRTAEFPAGFMTQYHPSLITGGDEHQALAPGFPIGKRFRSHPVMRVCDGTPRHLGHESRADGRWRIQVFADADAPGADSQASALGEFLVTDPSSPLLRSTRPGDDLDSVIEVNVIHQQPHTEIDLPQVHRAYQPRLAPFDLVDRERVYAAPPGDDIFAAREISRDGCVVVVRPDQYVAAVLPLDDPQALASFFEPILLDVRGQED